MNNLLKNNFPTFLATLLILTFLSTTGYFGIKYYQLNQKQETQTIAPSKSSPLPLMSSKPQPTKSTKPTCHPCRYLAPHSTNFCQDGLIIPQGQDECHCPQPPKCFQPKCPEGNWINCMPIISEKDQLKCSPEAISWYKENCQDFKGIAQ